MPPIFSRCSVCECASTLIFVELFSADSISGANHALPVIFWILLATGSPIFSTDWRPLSSVRADWFSVESSTTFPTWSCCCFSDDALASMLVELLSADSISDSTDELSIFASIFNRWNVCSQHILRHLQNNLCEEMNGCDLSHLVHQNFQKIWQWWPSYQYYIPNSSRINPL